MTRLRLFVLAAVAVATVTVAPTRAAAEPAACENRATKGGGYVLRYPKLGDGAEKWMRVVGGVDRRLGDVPLSYMLYVPPGISAEHVPLLVTLHGLGGSGGQHAEKSAMVPSANRHGYIIAAPSGFRSWDNSDRGLDIGFIRDVVADVRRAYCIDARRIFASGHSNGAFMTHRLACDAADLFAAGASMAAGDVENGLQGGPCQPAGRVVPAGEEPMPLAMWHGNADSVVRYESGRLGLEKWLKRYQCATTPRSTTKDAFGRVEVYGGCTRADALRRPNFEVRFRTLDEHDHGWANGCGGTPTCDPANPERPFPTSDQLNEEMWAFLSAHPRTSDAG